MAETKMQLVDWLDDLCVRFIINLPGEELDSVERICFQVEEAQWFYEDFVRPLDPTLPSLSLRQFCLLMFQHCPLLAQFSEYHHLTAFSEFLAYKTRVPVRGAIMLNDAMDHVVMVRGWKSNASWSFPRGKINKAEKDIDCAIREAYEETGFDLRAAGLADDETKVKHIEVTLREQHMMLFVFRGIPMDAHLEPKTRKEIGKIQWYKLTELPTFKKRTKQTQHGHGADTHSSNKFYMVAPFLVPLKKWIAYQRKLDAGNSKMPNLLPNLATEDDPVTADETDQYLQEDQELLGKNTTESIQSRFNNSMQTSPFPARMHDPTTDLKRMLSIGQEGAHQAAPSIASPAIESNSNKLLALFQRGPSQAPPSNPESGTDARRLLDLLKQGSGSNYQQPALSIDPPHTPFDQIQFNSAMPPSPRHHHPRPPPFSSMAPPPPFPISQSSPLSAQRFPDDHPMERANGKQLPLDVGYQLPPHVQYGSHAPVVSPYLQDSLRADMRQVQRPYQQTGDPQFAQPSEFPGSQVPIVPPASNLPPPKLSSHALGMLNIFKSNNKSAVADFATVKAQIAQDGQPSGQNEYSQRKTSSQQREVSSRTLSTIPLPNTSPLPSSKNMQEASLSDSPVLSESIRAPSRTNNNQKAHQDTLLKLFRTPSERPNPSIREPTPAFPRTLGPVELAAMPSPAVYGQQRTPEKLTAIPGLTAKLQPSTDTLKASRLAENPASVSATVSGPLAEPDFGSVRRSRAKKASREDFKIEHSKINPIQILKRPTSSNGPIPTTTLKPNSPTPAKAADEPKAITPKPFQPTILRRPQPSPKVVESPEQPPTLVETGRRPSAADQHKEALLSLFSKPGISSTHPERPSPVTVPGGLSENRSPLSIPIMENMSMPSLVDPPEDPSRARVSSLVAQRTGTTSTPISPLDKSFLLGYLDGVVKNAGR